MGNCAITGNRDHLAHDSSLDIPVEDVDDKALSASDLVRPAPLASNGCVIPSTEHRGITIPQLKAIFASASAELAVDVDSPIDPAKLNLYDLVSRWIKPRTEERRCSMVELLAEGPQVPDWFVSHWWGEPVCDFIACLEQHAYDRHLVAPVYWVCAYALRQHALDTELPATAESHGAAAATEAHSLDRSPFARALALTKGTVSIVDREGIVFQRAWCGYELYLTLIAKELKLHDIYTAAPGYKNIPAVGLLDGFTHRDRTQLDWYVDRFHGRQSKTSPMTAMTKAIHESFFPVQLAAAAFAFSLAASRASVESDKAAIELAVGEHAFAVDSTVRARFVVARLPVLLIGKGEGAMQALLPALRTLRSSVLSQLSLFCADDPNAELVEQLGAHLPQGLQELRAESVGCSLVDALAVRVASGELRSLALRNPPRVGGRGLVIPNTQSLQSKDVLKLAQALRNERAQLAELNLRDNSIDDVGAIALGEALGVNSTLKVLKLTSNKGLTQTGALSLAQLWQASGRKRELLELDDQWAIDIDKSTEAEEADK